MTNVSGQAELERRVRAAVAAAMRVPLDDWPAESPLTEVPDGIFDSLAKLEVVSTLEADLGSSPLSMDEDAAGLDCIAALTRWVATKLGELG
jgi:hypothetical protein